MINKNDLADDKITKDKKIDIDNKLKLEKELISMAAKRKSNNLENRSKEMLFSRTSNYKDLIPLVSSSDKNEKFLFENDASINNAYKNDNKISNSSNLFDLNFLVSIKPNDLLSSSMKYYLIYFYYKGFV